MVICGLKIIVDSSHFCILLISIMHMKFKQIKVFSRKKIVLFLSIFCIFTYASVVLAIAPTSGLVGYWNLDGSANDFSGGGNNGTVNGVSSWVIGKINQALSFNGSNYVSISHISSLNPGSSLWSVSAWVKGNSDGSVLWKGSSSLDLYKLAVDGGNAIFNINAGGDTVSTTAKSSVIVNDGNWHLITGVRSSVNKADIYVYGILSGTSTYAGSGISIDTTTPLIIGSENGNKSFFSGLIDDVRVYNRALSSSEVLDVYNADQSGSINPPSVTDATLPAVSLSNPLPNTTISGSITISSTASDNVGVVGVQFKLDGLNLNSEDISSPYSISWDTTTVSNGSHTLTAVARDASGNTTISSGVSVMVSNSSNTGCSYPAQILNLTNWKETLPIGKSGSPIEIIQPSLATYSNSPYFIVNDGCNGVQFRAPVNGVSTSNSNYPRSELREMSDSGTKNASWKTKSGVHTMFIDQAITAVPQIKKHIVVGQIHDASDDVIVIRLEYPKLFIDINGVNGPTLDPDYVLGKRFTVKFIVSNGKINIYYNGSATPSYTLNKNGSGYYFKAGAYTQSNCTKETSCSSSNYGEVNIYNLWVQHQSPSSPLDINSPVLSQGLPSSILSAGTTNKTLSLSTNKEATCRYSTVANTLYDNMLHSFTNTGTTNHSVLISGLNNGTNYNYYVRCQDYQANTTTGDYIISFSVASPNIITSGDNNLPPASSSSGSGGGSSTSAPSSGGGSAVSTINSNTSQVSPVSTSNSAIHTFATYLYYGIISPEVKYLQDFLISQGLLVLDNTTNYYGRLTMEAVMAFQKLNGILQTGTIGPITREVINKKNTKVNLLTKNLTFGMENVEVKILQEFLAVKGYFNASPTGYYGHITQNAVKEFQKANGIDQVGIVGPLTLAVINDQLK